MDIEETAREFTDELTETEAFETLESANQKMQRDEEATSLMDKFESKQQECQTKQEQETLSRDDLQELRSIRAELGQNEAFTGYQRAVRAFQDVCGKSIESLSSTLGMNIAAYLSKGGCC